MFTVFGYKKNPVYNDGEAEYVQSGNTKKGTIGLVKIMLCELHCGCVMIYQEPDAAKPKGGDPAPKTTTTGPTQEVAS